MTSLVAGEGRGAFNSKQGNMSIRNQRGQTGIAVLALLVALVALGVSVYTYLEMAHNVELRSQMTTLQELSERGRQEMADALKRLEERIGETNLASRRPSRNVASRRRRERGLRELAAHEQPTLRGLVPPAVVVRCL